MAFACRNINFRDHYRCAAAAGSHRETGKGKEKESGKCLEVVVEVEKSEEEEEEKETMAPISFTSTALRSEMKPREIRNMILKTKQMTNRVIRVVRRILRVSRGEVKHLGCSPTCISSKKASPEGSEKLMGGGRRTECGF